VITAELDKYLILEMIFEAMLKELVEKPYKPE
jgi:hypothetical protein